MWQSTENIVLVGRLCFCPHSQPQEKPYNNNLTVKLPVPKCKRINSRLQEGAAGKNQISRGLIQEEVSTLTFWKRIYCMQLLSNDMCCSMSLNIIMFFVYSEYCNMCIRKQRDHTMHNIFAYKRLKIMENYKTVRQKYVTVTYARCSFTRGL